MTALNRMKLMREVECILADGGVSISEACRKAGTNKHWYYRWRHRLDTATELALSDEARPGRPCKTSAAFRIASALEDQERKIKKIEGTINSMKDGLKKIKTAVATVSTPPQ